MLKKEHEILTGFVSYPWKKLTFRQVKELSGKKSESYVFDSLKRFVKSDILLEEKIGNTILYSLNLSSIKARSYVGFVAEYMAWNARQLPIKELEKLARLIPTDFYVFIITGSYARNLQQKKSDIDAVIICDDSAEPKKIYAELRHESEMSIPTVHLFVFKKSEFLSMLLDKKANYGKETAKNNLILSGGQEYYSIINEVLEHGFVG